MITPVLILINVNNNNNKSIETLTLAIVRILSTVAYTTVNGSARSELAHSVSYLTSFSSCHMDTYLSPYFYFIFLLFVHKRLRNPVHQTHAKP